MTPNMENKEDGVSPRSHSNTDDGDSGGAARRRDHRPLTPSPMYDEAKETIAALRAELGEAKAYASSFPVLQEQIAALRAENEAQKEALKDQLTARKHNEAEIARLRAAIEFSLEEGWTPEVVAKFNAALGGEEEK